MSVKIKVFLLSLLLLAFSVIPTWAAERNSFVEVINNNEMLIKLNADTIIRDGDSWFYTIALLDRKAQPVVTVKFIDNEYNVSKGQNRMIRGASYDINGKSKDISVSHEWMGVSPGSVGEQIIRAVLATWMDKRRLSK